MSGITSNSLANRISNAVGSLLQKARGQSITLVSVKPLAQEVDLTAPRAEARKAFNDIAKQTAQILSKADQTAVSGADYSKNITNLNTAFEELQLGTLDAKASPAAIHAAEAALTSLNVAVAFGENHEAKTQLNDNDLAKSVAFQASELDKRARALEKHPGMEKAAALIKATAEDMRQEVRLNYLQAPTEPFSLKEVANFKALHFDAGVKVADKIISDLKGKLAKDPANPEIKEQIANLTKYKESLELQGADYKGELFQSNQTVGLDTKAAKKMMGGRENKLGVKSIMHLGSAIKAKIEKSAFTKSGAAGKLFADKNGGALHMKSAMAAHLAGFLKSQGIEGYKIEGLRKEISSGFRDGVEAQPWVKIDRPLDMLVSDSSGQARSVRFQNTLVPAKDISPQLAQTYKGIQGVSSLSNAEPNHAVNMWKTSYKAENGQYAFSGIRHGVHDAYDIKDKDLRTKASDNKVAEFIQASAQGSPHLLKPNDDGTYTLNIVSVSLLTPVGFTHEDKMLPNQVAAYERANELGKAGGIPITIQDANGQSKEVLVRPNIVAFNSGVNSWSLSKHQGVRAAFGGWKQSDALNNQNLPALIGGTKNGDKIGGLAGEALLNLERLALDPELSDEEAAKIDEKMGTIRSLVDQIRTITNADSGSPLSHKQIGADPYKLPVRLLALANEVGASPAFNCKSGKDRTGQMDVEIKDFYTHLNANGGQVREINHKRNEVEASNFKKIFEHGGGRELQKFNTGIPGSKVDLKSFYSVLGYSSNNIDELKGLSKWVGS